MNPRLETSRLLLQPWREDDALEFLPMAQDPEVLRFINGGVPWTEEDARAFALRQTTGFEERGYCRWKLVAREDGAFVGFCGGELMAALGDVEIGWWIVRDRWRRGLASEAARTALDDLRGRIGLRRIVSIAQRDNTASIRIMQKLGLDFERTVEHRGFPCVLYTWNALPTPAGAARRVAGGGV